ncbi:hypothetical protein E2542_SST22086 [Spatholobus suberectus]|nr:hypothetical protein E2542_SST22086 [Spatholobus suberectus]
MSWDLSRTSPVEKDIEQWAMYSGGNVLICCYWGHCDLSTKPDIRHFTQTWQNDFLPTTWHFPNHMHKAADIHPCIPHRNKGQEIRKSCILCSLATLCCCCLLDVCK